MVEELNRDERLASFLSKSKKTFGEGKVEKVKDAKSVKCNRFSSGVFDVDCKLGGGWPFGKFSMIFGPEAAGKSTLATLACATLQNYSANTRLYTEDPNEPRCRALYVDSESVFDEEWANCLGFDSNQHVIARSENAEEAIEIIRAALSSEVFDLIVLDSIAAMTPKGEADSNIEQELPGLQARKVNKAFRIWQGLMTQLGEKSPAFIYTNQTRLKIGVMYGCFPSNTKVFFTDGSSHEIKDIVDNKLVGPVWSFNKDTGFYEEKNIINWFNNGKLSEDEKWISFEAESTGDTCGTKKFTCTENHLLFCDTIEGLKEVNASDIKVGDYLVAPIKEFLPYSPRHRDIIFGSLLGDGSIALCNKSGVTASFKLCNQEQIEYLDWKLDALQGIQFMSNGSLERPAYLTKPSKEFGDLYKVFYPNSTYREIPADLKLTPLMAAIWWMDDGHLRKNRHQGSICIKRFSLSNLQSNKKRSLDLLIDFVKVGSITLDKKEQYIIFDREAMRAFLNLICMYVPKCMEYKLFSDLRGKYDMNISKSIEYKTRNTKSKVLKKYISVRKQKYKTKYDLQIEGNSSYLVGGGGGVLVHNSPETVPGGIAQLYYPVIRMRLSQIKMKDGGDKLSAFAEAKGVFKKNKTFTQGLETSFSYSCKNVDGFKKGEVLNAIDVFKQAKKYGLVSHELEYPSGIGDAMATKKVRLDSEMIDFLRETPEALKYLWEKSLDLFVK